VLLKALRGVGCVSLGACAQILPAATSVQLNSSTQIRTRRAGPVGHRALSTADGGLAAAAAPISADAISGAIAIHEPVQQLNGMEPMGMIPSEP
jgi:hypothetical protein